LRVFLSREDEIGTVGKVAPAACGAYADFVAAPNENPQAVLDYTGDAYA
jgi:hypothetical protein